MGADPDFANLVQARDRLHLHAALNNSRRRGWDLAGADITRLPFARCSFDLVVCSEVLEHIQDHCGAVREIARVLKPEGHLVISVPRRWPETVCWALSGQYRRSPGGHVRIYGHRRLIRIVERITRRLHWHTHYAHSLHSPYWWLKCLVGLQRDRLWPVRQYQRLLTWDMMQKPLVTRFLDRCLNPVMGKSVVLYFRSGVPSAAE